MSLLILLTVFVFTALWAPAFSSQFSVQIKDGLRALRVSVIDESGAVLLDNRADPGTMESHLNRPEVIEAIQNGVGEEQRFSDTLDEKTYYYAVRMSSGNILRLALTTTSMVTFIYRLIPVFLLCLILAIGLAFVAARKLTKRLVSPINNLDLDAPDLKGYDELLPLLKKIETQKQELSAQLAEIENRTATILAITGNMQEGLLLLDAGGRILLANESVLNILDQRTAVGKRLIEVCRDSSVLEKAKACLTGEKGETSLQINNRFYSVFLNPVIEEERLHGMVALFIDVTQRYAAERQRKEFSANVSHELKTPLTIIAALSEIIADGTAKQEDIQSFAEKIRKQSRHLIDMIDDIIRLSELDEASAQRKFSRFNLYDAANTIVGSLAEKAVERNITIELRGNPQLFVTANMRMIDELIYDLVDNAIKYNRDGGSVTVTLTDTAESVCISVRDTGIGIPQEHLGRIFERFYRVDKSRSKKMGGTGLGLSIVKHVAEFHGGYVDVNSQEGIGTVVACTFKNIINSKKM